MFSSVQKNSFTKVIDSTSVAAALFLDWITSSLVTFGWSKEEQYPVRHAILEAVNNALEHGNRFDRQKKIFFSGEISGEKIWITIRDEGDGFDLDILEKESVIAASDQPRGRGIFFIRHAMTSVRFNQTGNELTLEKIR